MSELRNGFLIVASRKKEYVEAANFCGATIKDYYPDAHVTLFVPDHLSKHADTSAFDLLKTDVPDHQRTKLYALSQTPYSELTCYVDADMECRHEDVKTIWDQIKPEQDILITKIRGYNGKIHKWPKGEMIHHGGFFLYRTNPKTLNFMSRWWEDYRIQRTEPWPYNEEEYPTTLREWDQFTFWKLLNLDKFDINVGFFKDDARWNFVHGYKPNETSSPIIFWHHTLPSIREY